VRSAFCSLLLLLVYKLLNITVGSFSFVASEVIFFQQKPVLKEVMEAVEEMAERVYGPRKKKGGKRKTGKSPLGQPLRPALTGQEPIEEQDGTGNQHQHSQSQEEVGEPTNGLFAHNLARISNDHDKDD
jgi:hypothetical protein